MWIVERLLELLVLGAGVVIAAGIAVAVVLRKQALGWTWGLLGLPVSFVAWQIDPVVGAGVFMVAGLACLLGMSWHQKDLVHGADLAEAANARLGLFGALRRIDQMLSQRPDGGWVRDGWLRLGKDQRGLPVSIPVGYESGCHTLVLGATGAGKTVSEA
jgi:hypothetical protein